MGNAWKDQPLNLTHGMVKIFILRWVLIVYTQSYSYRLLTKCVILI